MFLGIFIGMHNNSVFLEIQPYVKCYITYVSSTLDNDVNFLIQLFTIPTCTIASSHGNLTSKSKYINWYIIIKYGST